MARTYAAALCLLLAVQLQLQPVAPRSLRMRARDHGRVIGGSDASMSDYPWMLALQLGDSQSCGASIVGSQWALTAAHCLLVCGRRPEDQMYNLRAGSNYRSSGGTILYVAECYEHELHDSYTGDYDITLLRTNESFPLGTNVGIVNLPVDGYDPPVGLAVTLTGWGQTESWYYSDTLLKVDINVRERSACDFPGSDRQVTPRMLCAGQTGLNACYGDSGSPLVSGSTQVGIASWGSGTDCMRGGSVYVNVGNLRSWITKISGI